MEATEQMAAVALVLLLLGAALWALKRRGFAGVVRGRTSGRRLECVERLPLGPQQVLHLVRMGEMELLVASSPSGCTLLKSFGRREAEEDQ